MERHEWIYARKCAHEVSDGDSKTRLSVTTFVFRMHANLWFDGACYGNPGPGAGGAHLEFEGDNEPVRVHRALAHCTNNQAEYTGLIIGLVQARREGVTSITIRGDSRLVIEQVRGKWRVKARRLQPYVDEVRRLLKGIHLVSLEWVPRSENTKADSASRGRGTIPI